MSLISLLKRLFDHQMFFGRSEVSFGPCSYFISGFPKLMLNNRNEITCKMKIIYETAQLIKTEIK